MGLLNTFKNSLRVAFIGTIVALGIPINTSSGSQQVIEGDSLSEKIESTSIIGLRGTKRSYHKVNQNLPEGTIVKLAGTQVTYIDPNNRFLTNSIYGLRGTEMSLERTLPEPKEEATPVTDLLIPYISQKTISPYELKNIQMKVSDKDPSNELTTYQVVAQNQVQVKSLETPYNNNSDVTRDNKNRRERDFLFSQGLDEVIRATPESNNYVNEEIDISSKDSWNSIEKAKSHDYALAEMYGPKPQVASYIDKYGHTRFRNISNGRFISKKTALSLILG